MNEFTKQSEIILISYDEVIKNPYPFILKQIATRYRKYYEEFVNFSLFENLDDNNLLRFCIQRTEKNIFRYIAKKEFDYDAALENIFYKFDDMYMNSEHLVIGNTIPMLLSQKFTQNIYVYSKKYDPRIHIDLEMTYRNMDVIKYVTGDFDEVINTISGITSYILNDVDYIVPLVFNKKTEYTNVMIASYGYNYAENLDNKIVLRINVDELTTKHIFKCATFMPINFTDKYFTDLPKKE